MKITTSGDFAASCDEVFAVIADEEFQSGMTGEGGTATVMSRSRRVVVTTKRVYPTDGMPDFARTFVGDTLKLTEIQDWGPPGTDGTRTGTLALTVDGAPLKLDGTLRLEPVDGGCRQSVEADLKARVPLVGGRIEQAAAPAVEHAIQDEYAAIRQRLGG